MFSLFLTLRLSVLALLVYLNFLVLVFASWNIHSSTVSESPVSIAAVILLLSNCASFVAIAFALSELVEPKVKLSLAWLECGWAAVIGNVQIAAAIAVTVENPALMCQSHQWSVCASGSLLIPASWVMGVAASTYFLSLLVSIMVHRTSVPDIWFTSIYDIPWFNPSSSPYPSFDPHKLPLKPDTLWGDSPIMSSADDKESQRSVKSVPQTHEPPTWAKDHQVVRGKQAPFAAKSASQTRFNAAPLAPVRRAPSPDRTAAASPPPTIPLPAIPGSLPITSRTGAPTHIPLHSYTPATTSTLPRPSPVSLPRSENHPQVKESHQLHRSGTASWSSRSDLSMFPEHVKNDDLPIPKTRTSQWVRLDVPVV